MKMVNLVAVLESVREFRGEAHTPDYFTQRMGQIQALLGRAHLDGAEVASLQGCMVGKIDISLLVELGLSLAATWSETKVRLREGYRDATQSVAHVTWRMCRPRIEPKESVAKFSRRVEESLRLTKEQLLETAGEPVAET